MLNLKNLLKLVLGKRFIIIFVLLDFVFFLLNFIFNSKLIFSTFDFWRNHKNIVQSHYNWIIVFKILCLFKFLGKKVSILFYHFVYHLLNHSKIHHDIILCQPMTLLQILKSICCFVVNHVEYFFNVNLDLINLFNCCFVLDNIFLVFNLALCNFFFQFFL